MAASSFVDGVKVYSQTTGSGPLVLGVAVQGYRGVSALTDQAQYSYSISQPTGEFEFGQGIYTALTATLTRTVLWSSAPSNAPIALTGLAVVTFTMLAEDIAGLLLVINSNGPPPNPVPPQYFQFYRDTQDGGLKVISSGGTVTPLAAL